MATDEAIKPEAPPVAPPAPTTTGQGHPTGFWFIFSGELAERASFYGMRAILTMYLIQVFAYGEDKAGSLVHLYVAACYFAPIIGGLIADQLLNKYWTIVAFSIPYICGQFIVGLSNEYLMFGALALLALGSGVIKPNISTLMGLTYDQQRPGNDALRTKAFGLFYMAINIGSFLSTLICPALRNSFGQFDPETKQLANPEKGYLVAFLFPACLMVVALTFFAFGKKFYAREELGVRKWGKVSAAVNPEEFKKNLKSVGQIVCLFF
ncbi:MFS transporter [Fimbriiglobus ruber]|uniref:POT-type proton-dependent oligopeptide transporter n=1 Tax=Fimbriiglobus ruber TaxID=1908690 RepID=UPI00117A055F|nr:MFS transporter [Fimbriiglobus ruber]